MIRTTLAIALFAAISLPSTLHADIKADRVTVQAAAEKMKAANPEATRWKHSVMTSKSRQEGIYVNLGYCIGLSNIDALAGMPVTFLDMQRPLITHLNGLKGTPLQQLYIMQGAYKLVDISGLKDCPLTHISIRSSKVSDISVLKGLPLKRVDLGSTPVTDLSPLKQMALDSLILSRSKVTDLSTLKGASIKELWLDRCKITDLSALKGMPLEELRLQETGVIDLSPLKGMPLKKLLLEDCTAVKDISPLSGMKLEELNIEDTGVTDLSPLKGMPLESLSISSDATNIDFLKQIASLEKINGSSVANFWKKYDAQ